MNPSDNKLEDIEEQFGRLGYLYGEQDEWLISKIKEQDREIAELRARLPCTDAPWTLKERDDAKKLIIEQILKIEWLTRSGDESWQKLRDDVCDARHEEQAQQEKAEKPEADLARCTENFDLEQRKIMEWRTKAEKAENLLAGKGKPCTCGTGYDPECPSEHGAEKEKV